MESIKEIASSLGDWFNSRVVNPLFAAFLVSWVIINWRLVLALSSDTPYKEKINWIDTKLYPKAVEAWWYCLGQPLLIALSYVYIGPPIFRVVISYHRRQLIKTRERLTLDDAVELLTVEKGQQLRQEVYLAQVAVRDVTRKASEEKAELIAELNQVKEQLEGLEKNNFQLHQNISGKVGNSNVLQDGMLSLEHFWSDDLPLKLLKALKSRGVSNDEIDVMRTVESFGPLDSLSTLNAALPRPIPNLAQVLRRLETFSVIERDGDGIGVTRAGEELLQFLR